MASFSVQVHANLNQNDYGTNSSVRISKSLSNVNYYKFYGIDIHEPVGYYISGYGDDAILLKFDISPLNNYKKKAINSLIMGIKTNIRPGTVGGTLSWLNVPFNTQAVTYNTQPDGDVAFLRYAEEQDPDGYYYLPIVHYGLGFVGYNGTKSPRSFYDQLSVGFLLSNLASYNDRKNVDYNLGTWESPRDFVFQFEMSTWNPALTARFPISNAYINAAIANTFSVAFDAFQSIDYPTAQTITYEIKDVSTGTVVSHDATVSINLKGRNYLEWTVPANTVVTGKNYQWRAKIVTDDGTTSFSDWANFTTLDATPGLPTIISPQSKYLDGAAATTLTWRHNVSTGSAQYAYDLQYKQAGDWVSIISHAVSSTQTYTVPANFFAAGQMYWRVRTYNTDNTPGDWGTSSANVVQAKPVTPIIQSITTAPRSTISWQSVGQQAYQLVVKNASGEVMQDTGETYGTDKSKTIDLYLPDGNYTFDLTIQNGQGVWSDHAVQSVHIANSPPLGDDQLTVTSLFGAVKLDLMLPNPKGVDYVGETYVGESYAAHQPYYASGTRYVLRDGEPIAKVTGTTYIDYTPSGTHQYAIRIVTAEGNYKDTNTVTAEPIIKYACISKYNSPQNVLTLKFNQGSKPVLDRQLSKVLYSHYFAGRALPVYDVTEHHDSAWSFTYSFLSQSDYDSLYQLFLDGDTVMFRDHRGYKAVGTITSVKQVPSYRNINVINFSISESDASEVIDYD